MRISSPLLRSGATLAAATVLPVALAAAPAPAGPGISVSTTGTTVSVTTTACAQLNGSWGTASLLTSSQRDFAQGVRWRCPAALRASPRPGRGSRRARTR